MSIFEGGASEDDLLAITEIAADWQDLRAALEQAAFITPEQLHPAITISALPALPSRARPLPAQPSPPRL
jgi:hypothetical protein